MKRTAELFAYAALVAALLLAAVVTVRADGLSRPAPLLAVTEAL